MDSTTQKKTTMMHTTIKPKRRKTMTNPNQTDIIEYTDAYFKGVQSAQDEMKQKIEDKFQLWEQEGYVDKAVAASVFYSLLDVEDY